LTFIEALKSGRPMRRPWRTALSPWLFLGTEPSVSGPAPRWRSIADGSTASLDREDYLAENWQVMP
jgi:hypothetical protein